MRSRRIRLAALGLVVALVGWSGACGPLLPWSPWRPGWSTWTLPGGRVLHTGAVPRGLERLPDLMREAEAFHGLPFLHPVTLVLCESPSRSWQVAPQAPRGALAITTITGSTIHLLPAGLAGALPLDELLRHELSHALLHQHQDVWAAFRASRRAWFVEGQAVAFARHRFCPPVASLDRSTLQTALERPETAIQEIGVGPAYAAWSGFVEHLKQRHGAARFQALQRLHLQSPSAPDEVLPQVLGTSLAAELAALGAPPPAGLVREPQDRHTGSFRKQP